MNIKKLTVGMLGTNCYILKGSDSVCVIDPGADADEILLATEGATVDKILLTHGHFDHFMAAENLKSKTGAKIYVSREDSGKLDDFTGSLYDILGIGDKGFIGAKADCFYEDVIELSGEVFRVLKTPGHSEGSICLLSDKILFSGDTLFKRSIGRYDRGNYQDIMHSLKNLMLLDDDTLVLPGHGDSTTIGEERISNPFLL